jgi:hypothetical protein
MYKIGVNKEASCQTFLRQLVAVGQALGWQMSGHKCAQLGSFLQSQAHSVCHAKCCISFCSSRNQQPLDIAGTQLKAITIHRVTICEVLWDVLLWEEIVKSSSSVQCPPEKKSNTWNGLSWPTGGKGLHKEVILPGLLWLQKWTSSTQRHEPKPCNSRAASLELCMVGSDQCDKGVNIDEYTHLAVSVTTQSKMWGFSQP